MRHWLVFEWFRKQVGMALQSKIERDGICNEASEIKAQCVPFECAAFPVDVCNRGVNRDASAFFKQDSVLAIEGERRTVIA